MTEIPPAVLEFMAASARDYVLELLREPALINALVEPRLQQLIAAGDIVPRSRLQLGVGLELAPLGLEQAARALIAAAGDTEMPELHGFTESLAALVAVLERVEAPTLPAELPDLGEEQEKDGAQEAPTVVEHHCELCDKVVDVEQALASKTRWRKVLCKEHHASYDPKKRKKAS